MSSQSLRAFARPFAAAFACAAMLLPASVRADETGSVSCPVLSTKIDAITKANQSSDYKGVRYYFCCDGCKPQFDKDQTKFLKDAKNKDKVLGISLFDPVTTKRLSPEKATMHSEFGGVRYFFAKEDDKTAFDKEPKKFTVAPKKEILYCPVSDALVASPAEASDFSDYKGARYYFCCAGCKPQFDKSPDKYLDGLDARIKAAQDKQAAAAGKDSGK